MDKLTFKEWPFPFLKPEAEWTQFDRDLIAFMRTACAEGYRPRQQNNGTAIEAGEESGRSKHQAWAPLRPRIEQECLCVFGLLSAVAYFALEWLRGRTLESLLSDSTFVGELSSRLGMCRRV